MGHRRFVRLSLRGGRGVSLRGCALRKILGDVQDRTGQFDLEYVVRSELPHLGSLSGSADHASGPGVGREKARSVGAPQMVLELESGGLCHALHGIGWRANNLHDQLAFRRSGTASLEKTIPARLAIPSRIAD